MFVSWYEGCIRLTGPNTNSTQLLEGCGISSSKAAAGRVAVAGVTVRRAEEVEWLVWSQGQGDIWNTIVLSSSASSMLARFPIYSAKTASILREKGREILEGRYPPVPIPVFCTIDNVV